MTVALEAAGIPLARRFLNVRANRELHGIRNALIATIIDGVQRRGASAAIRGRCLCVNQELTVAVIVMPHFKTDSGEDRWSRCVRTDRMAEILVAARMSGDHKSIEDYCIIPTKEVPANVLRLSRCTDRILQAYRFDDLSLLFDIVERRDIGECRDAWASQLPE
jgi:hypothetical protein